MTQRLQSRDPKILRCLQYFEAVARHGSIRRASEEIGVTASAVSHQMRELTRMLGEELFIKQGRGIALTETGANIARELERTFSDLESLIGGVVGDRRQQLRLAVCSSFGPAWLARRLPRFNQANPDIDLELRLYAKDPEQSFVVADAFVTAMPIKPGFDSVGLFEEMLVMVAAPDLLAGLAEGASPALITTDIERDDLGAEWLAFLAATGDRHLGLKGGVWLKCTHYLLALELAKAGAGLALVPDFLAEESLANGSLVCPDRTKMPAGRSYRLCYKSAKAADPGLRRLVAWMKAESQDNVVPFQRAARGHAGQDS